MRNIWIILALILCVFIIFLWSPWEVVKNTDQSLSGASSIGTD